MPIGRSGSSPELSSPTFRRSLIAPLSCRARALGAQIVLVHGETIVEPVPPGTNHQAIEAGVDILAHPGLISGGGCDFGP